MKKLTIISIAVAAILTACSKVENRLEPTVVSAKRAVLIEDFTGQKCVNCPMATNTLHSLHEYFGDSIIAVAIHGGGFGFDEPKGLATAEAKTYYDQFNITEQPIGIINHDGKLTSYTKWSSSICDIITTPTTAYLTVIPTVENDSLSVSVFMSAESQINGTLNVWLTEDSIVGIQSLPEAWGGGNDKNYVHNHVYRKAINGTAGTPVSFGENVIERSFKTTLASTYKSAYVPENLYIVAFVYTDEGVQKVVRTKVIN